MIDTSEHLDTRWRAVRAHRSQTSQFEGLPAEPQRAFLATDRLRRVVPPWEPGPVERSIL